RRARRIRAVRTHGHVWPLAEDADLPRALPAVSTRHVQAPAKFPEIRTGQIGADMPGDAFLSARDISVRFGGVLAVNKVSFDVKQGEVFTLIGPNGAGKTTVFNLISRIYMPTSGQMRFDGQALDAVAPHQVAAMGIARTFQNIELFEHATVLQNLLIGRHIRRASSVWSDMLFLPSVRAAERATRHKVEEVIDLLDLQHY